MRETNRVRLFIVMGVAGCGKSTIGQQLADRLGAIYLEGDTFHPKENIAKMSSGIPLNDSDRWPWLAKIGAEMATQSGKVVAGCSALKRSYRSHLEKHANEAICFIYLDGSRELIASRMQKREGHFMPDSLLESQFATLEVPGSDEISVRVDIDQSTEDVVTQILEALKSEQGGSHH